jgi:hypothetical protein
MPIDAAGRKLIRKHRVPVDSSWPMSWWIANVDKDSEEMPTELEIRQIRSYIEFTVHQVYNETYIQKILVERKLPWDQGHVTLILRKVSPDSWRYRIRTWEHGPRPMESGLSLNTLFEMLQSRFSDKYVTAWRAWKAERPELFPVTT